MDLVVALNIHLLNSFYLDQLFASDVSCWLSALDDLGISNLQLQIANITQSSIIQLGII